jgi:hypothetical protein
LIDAAGDRLDPPLPTDPVAHVICLQLEELVDEILCDGRDTIASMEGWNSSQVIFRGHKMTSFTISIHGWDLVLGFGKLMYYKMVRFGNERGADLYLNHDGEVTGRKKQNIFRRDVGTFEYLNLHFPEIIDLLKKLVESDVC